MVIHTDNQTQQIFYKIFDTKAMKLSDWTCTEAICAKALNILNHYKALDLTEYFSPGRIVQEYDDHEI